MNFGRYLNDMCLSTFSLGQPMNTRCHVRRQIGPSISFMIWHLFGHFVIHITPCSINIVDLQGVINVVHFGPSTPNGSYPLLAPILAFVFFVLRILGNDVQSRACKKTEQTCSTFEKRSAVSKAETHQIHSLATTKIFEHVSMTSTLSVTGW